MSSFSEFELDCLAAHNEYRRQHSSPPLRLNRELCTYANQWAQHLIAMNTLQHRSTHLYGENLFMASGQSVRGRDAVKAWYDEIKYYNFPSGGFSMNTGHFTQVVWRDSQELGVAKATHGSTTIVVANYSPPGNYQGRFQENVLPKSRQ